MAPSVIVRNNTDKNNSIQIPRFEEASLEYSMKQFTRKIFCRYITRILKV